MNRTFLQLLISSTAVIAVGMLPINLMPLLVGSWVSDLGASSTRAGTLGAVELGAMALSASLLSPRMKDISRRRLAVTAGLAALVSHVLSAQSPNLDVLLALRFAAGLAEGALLVAASASIAGARDPERAFALIGISAGLVASALIAATPAAIMLGGASAAFWVMAGLAGMCLPLFIGLPSTGRDPDPDAQPIPRNELAGAGIVLTLSAVLVASGQAAVWSFSERIGESLDFEPGSIGLILAGASLAGIGGAGFAAVFGNRFGRWGPLLLGYLGVFLAIGLVTAPAYPRAFIVGQGVFAFAYFFVSPFVMGLAAELDGHGRVASALSAGLLVGAGVGPALGGWVVDHHSFQALGLMGEVFITISAVLLVSNGRLRRTLFTGSN